MKKRLKHSVSLILLFILICGFSFTGCRRSDVLEQKIYTEEQQVDQETETKEKDNQEDHLNKDEEITSKLETDDAQTERNQQDTNSVQGEEENGTTESLKYGEAAPVDAGEAKGSGSETAQVKGNDAESIGITETTGTTPTADEAEKETVNPDDGEIITIPESYSKIAAVGSTAAFVEMFGGSGRLKASSESFLNSSLAGSVFSDTGEVQVLWSGDGSAGLTGDISQLISLLAADTTGKGACLYDDTSLTGEQVQKLEAAGIAAYPINLSQNTSQAYKDQVTAIGEILGDDAVGKAVQYCDWYDSVLKKAEHAKPENSKYTLYISDWDDDASWQVSDQTGCGLAVSPSKTHVRLFNEYLSTAGVINRITEVSGELGQPRYWYVNPLIGEGQIPVVINGTQAETLKDQSNNKMTSVPSNDDHEPLFVGDEMYPAVITANREVQQKLESSKLTDGLWHVYPMDNYNGGYGYGWSLGGQVIYSTIHAEYDVYALPQGLCGSWASGTPESVLTSLWACSRFGGGIDLSEVKNELDNFYSTFCGDASIDTEALLN